MRDLSRFLIILGIVVVVIGLTLPLLSRLGIGRLPGDIVYRRGNFTFFFPLVTSIVISIVLSLVFWLFRR